MNGRRQTHCLLDCIAYALQTGQVIDDRPMYFGVWNAPFAVTEEGIAYYSGTIGIEDIAVQLEQLYGGSFRFLNDAMRSKLRNYTVFLNQLAKKTGDQFIFILVDLFYLPYPNQCYQVRHRPHIVIADRIEDNRCYLIDPYFSWEGGVSLELLKSSFNYQDLNLAAMLDKRELRHPDAGTMNRWVDKRMFSSPGSLIRQVDDLIDKLIAQENGCPLDKLAPSIEQISVLVKRLNGYDQAFSYLNEGLHIPCGEDSKAAPLLKKWDNLLLAAMRMVMTGNREVLHSLKSKLGQIAELESDINRNLWSLYEQWASRE